MCCYELWLNTEKLAIILSACENFYLKTIFDNREKEIWRSAAQS